MQMTTSSLDHRLYLNDDEYRRDKQNIESVVQYMSRCGPTVDMYDVPCINSSDKLEYTYVPELHRHGIRKIISFFGDIHKKRWSMKSFEESNIVFHRGEMKFKGLEFKERLHAMDKEEDMKNLHQVIENMISRYNHNNYSMPTAIEDLLTHIKDYRYDYNFFFTR